MPARAEYIALARLALTGLADIVALSEESLADLKLALTEAVSNSVRHAYAGGAGFVSIGYELTGDALAVEVVDDGRGFDPDRPPPLEGEELTEGGLGIAIIRTIADEFELHVPAGCPRLAPPVREAAAPARLTVVNIRQRPGGSSSSSATARRSRTA